MEALYHRQILEEALGGWLGRTALELVYQANIGQDSWVGMIQHPEFHFDDNQIRESLAYVEQQQAQAVAAIQAGRFGQGLEAFGRLSHALQDFFAHSNYVDLWLAANGGPERARVEDIEPPASYADQPGLFTASVAALPFLLSRLPLVGSWLRPRVCAPDHHEMMNLDTPEQGPKFAYAFQAAVKATRQAYQELLDRVGQEETRQAFESWAVNGSEVR